MYVWIYNKFCLLHLLLFNIDIISIWLPFLQMLMRKKKKKFPDIPHYIHTIHIIIIHSTRGTEIILTFCCGAWCDMMWCDARCDGRDTQDGDKDEGMMVVVVFVVAVVRCDENVNRENRDWKIWQRWSEKSFYCPISAVIRFPIYKWEFKCCLYVYDYRKNVGKGRRKRAKDIYK